MNRTCTETIRYLIEIPGQYRGRKSLVFITLLESAVLTYAKNKNLFKMKELAEKTKDTPLSTIVDVVDLLNDHGIMEEIDDLKNGEFLDAIVDIENNVIMLELVFKN